MNTGRLSGVGTHCVRSNHVHVGASAVGLIVHVAIVHWAIAASVVIAVRGVAGVVSGVIVIGVALRQVVVVVVEVILCTLWEEL